MRIIKKIIIVFFVLPCERESERAIYDDDYDIRENVKHKIRGTRVFNNMFFMFLFSF